MEQQTEQPQLKPVQVDLRRVMFTGILGWVLLGLGLGAYQLWGSSPLATSSLLIPVAGIALGGIGLVWEKRNRNRYRAIAD